MPLPFRSIIHPVSCTYGAPMGRTENFSETNFPVKFCLRRVNLRQGYDSGGAYWGNGVPLWVAWGDGKEELQEVYLRAYNREASKETVRSMFPFAKFYR